MKIIQVFEFFWRILTFSSSAGPFSIACIMASEMRVSNCLTALSAFRPNGSIRPSTATTSLSTVSTYPDHARSSSDAGSVRQPLQSDYIFSAPIFVSFPLRTIFYLSTFSYDSSRHSLTIIYGRS